VTATAAWPQAASWWRDGAAQERRITASGLADHDLVVGEGEWGQQLQTVLSVNYRGTLEVGTEFDSKHMGVNQPFSFPSCRGSRVDFKKAG